ncbi:MAG: hypothetical protein RSB66_02125 [Clostridium sp.]
METYFDEELNSNPDIIYYIIDKKLGDVTGDGVLDEVYLLGTISAINKVPTLFENITIALVDGRSKKTTYLRFKYNSGFNPKLVLSHFRNLNEMDMFISIESPTEPSQFIFYLFSAVDNTPRSLFNFLAFDEYSEYRVKYTDYYNVAVTNPRTGLTFNINIGSRPKSYLTNMYNSDGTVKGIYEGDVLSLSYLTPIDLNTSGVNSLLAIQKIVGISKTDILGYVQTFLKFNGNEFIPSSVLVAVPGRELPASKTSKTKDTMPSRKKRK